MFNQPMKIKKSLQCLRSIGKRNHEVIFKAQIIKRIQKTKKEFVNSQSSQLEENDLQKLEADSVQEKHQK